jgi:hypothetical protein
MFAASVAVVVFAAAAAAQKPPQQKITPPEARYWMGATTSGGMGAMMGMAAGGGGMDMGAALRMATGGMPEYGQMVELRLGSSLSPTGAAEAVHAFPALAKVNQPIFLETPKTERPAPGAGSPYERPKGRIKFYWGCGERVGKGQPIVLDFEKLANGQMPDAELGGVDANEVRKPTAANSRTYGDWPNSAKQNQRLEARFPIGASLAGAHTVRGSYTPEINFNVARSFMAPVRYTSTAKAASGAIPLAWNAVPRATGYALGIIGGRDGGNQTAEMVLWSSAEQSGTFIMWEDLAPAEVARLIRAKAVLPPTTTSCTVPAEVVAEMSKAQSGGMLAFSAFGDQETFIHPPRPADPKVTWDQEWFARVSYKSTRMDMIGADGVTDMAAMMGGRGAAPGAMARGRDPAKMSDADYCAMLEAQKRERPSTAETLGSAIGIPGGGMLGRAIGGRKKQDEPVDPRCVKK